MTLSQLHNRGTICTSFIIALLIIPILPPSLGVRADVNSTGSDSQVPIKWALIVMGGYDYYRDLVYNAIQRIEKIMQGRGVPYDLFKDDDIVAPADNPPAGKYALQYASWELKYQVVALLFDYEYSDNACTNKNYIYWAVGNGTNAVLFNKAAMAVPELLGLASADVAWVWQSAVTSNTVSVTFSDGLREYAQSTTISLGAALYSHAVIHKSTGMTVWFNKTWTSYWSLGMANTTYGEGNVWYLGFGLNEYALEYSALRYQTSWSDWKMDFWGHSINFALNSVKKIDVAIMPYKRWKGAWIIRVDTDTNYWKEAFLPPESVLQSGWIYDYQYCVLGYGRTSGTIDLSLTPGAPPGYVGIPSTKIQHTSVTGVLQTNLNTKSYNAIVYNSTPNGVYDRIKLDFNENMNFLDDVEYRMWENMTYPTVLGKLYWCKITPDFSQPTAINIAWWQTPMLMQNENTNLPKWKQYGSDYGLAYDFHGWQHVRLEPGGSSYPMWNGTHFLLNASYIEEKFLAARYWMKEKFEGTGHGFEEDQVVISHPFNSHPSIVDQVIDNLPWVLFQYDSEEAYVGFGKKSATSKYTLVSANEERFSEPARFAVIEDMVKTLYPVVSTFTHGLSYNTTFSFPPYSNSITPANPLDTYHFWLEAKHMLENTQNAFYNSDKITLEFDAGNELKDYVWKFPVQLDGKRFSSFVDNRSIGEIKHTGSNYVYIEFNQGLGAQKLEVTYVACAAGVGTGILYAYKNAARTIEATQDSAENYLVVPSTMYYFNITGITEFKDIYILMLANYTVSGVKYTVRVAEPYVGSPPSNIIFNWTIPDLPMTTAINFMYGPKADLNLDGKVNMLDVAFINAHWYVYDQRYDVGNDGKIDTNDAAIISAHWYPDPPIGPKAHSWCYTKKAVASTLRLLLVVP